MCPELYVTKMSKNTLILYLSSYCGTLYVWSKPSYGNIQKKKKKPSYGGFSLSLSLYNTYIENTFLIR